MLQYDQENDRFIRVPTLHFALPANTHVLQRGFSVSQHRESTLRHTYKHNAFLTNWVLFLRKGLRNDQETLGFINFEPFKLK